MKRREDDGDEGGEEEDDEEDKEDEGGKVYCSVRASPLTTARGARRARAVRGRFQRSAALIIRGGNSCSYSCVTMSTCISQIQILRGRMVFHCSE